MAQQGKPGFRPAQFAKQADLEALSQDIHDHLTELFEDLSDLSRHAEVLELAVIKVAQDNEYLSDVLVNAGLLEPEGPDADDDEEVEEGPPGVGYPEFFDEPEEGKLYTTEEMKRLDPRLAVVRVDPDNPAHEVDLNDDFTAEGAPPAEDPEARQARIDAARARRAAAVEAQHLRELAEDANESSEAEMDTDPNSITDVPEEGNLVAPAKDEPEMYGDAS